MRRTLPPVARMFAAAGSRVDPLEQTQDIPGRIVAGQYSTNGVFRVTREPYECHTYAPELSEGLK